MAHETLWVALGVPTDIVHETIWVARETARLLGVATDMAHEALGTGS